MLVNGVVTLSRDHTVCQKGDKLSPEQAQILKLFYIQQAEFKLEVLGFWHDGSYTVLKENASTDDDAMDM
jgi:mRNA turnover protein 4